MEAVKIIKLKESILENNDADADALRAELRKRKIFTLNVMSSPGSGKTTLILATIKRLKERYRIGVMEADIDSAVDAQAVLDAGTRAVQLHTGGMCHLDAQMTRQGLSAVENLTPDAAGTRSFYPCRKEMTSRASTRLCLKRLTLF